MAKHNQQLIYSYLFSPSSAYYQKYRVKIVPGGALTTSGKIIEGLPSAPISLSFGAQYNGKLSNVASLMSKMQTMFQSFLKEFHQAKAMLGGNLDFISDVNTSDTVAIYSNSAKPSISVELILFRGFTPNVDSMLKYANEYVNPAEVDGCFIHSPGKYTPTGPCKDGVNSTNTYKIYVGKHMIITHMLPTSVNITPSPQLYIGDKPMYYKVNLSFEAGRILEASEVSQWFL